MRDLVGILLPFLGVFTLITGLAMWLAEDRCADTAQIMNVPYVWHWNTGCMVYYRAQFVPLKNLRFNNG